jgi:hypothetical protein
VPNVPLPYAGKLKLTTAKYYIPSVCFATFPVSMLMVLPSGNDTVFVITFI